MVTKLETHYGKKAGEVNYCLMAPESIRDLNRKFFRKDGETDVLAFPDEENGLVSGDVGLSIDTIRRDAREERRDFPDYFAEILLHGTLHLFGLIHDYTPASLKEVHTLHHRLLGELSLDWRAFDVSMV